MHLLQVRDSPTSKPSIPPTASRGWRSSTSTSRNRKAKVAKFTADNKLPYRVLLDEDAVVAGIYDIRGVPSMVLVDKNGMIVCRQCRDVEKLIEAALK